MRFENKIVVIVVKIACLPKSNYCEISQLNLFFLNFSKEKAC